ncbi:MAG: ABC transporter permease [Halodesulfurarchaeum sp.]
MSTDPDQSSGSTPASGFERSKNTFPGEVRANFVRWLKKFVRSPSAIVMDLIQPIIFLVLFTAVFGGIAAGPITEALGKHLSYLTFLLPAIAIQVSITTGQGAGITLVRDMDEWIFEKVMVSPMGTTAVFLGKTASELARIAVQILIILGLGVLMGAEIATGVPGILGVVLVGVLFSTIFVSLSTAIAMLTRDPEVMMSVTMPIMFPLLFLSNAFLPLAALPPWIRTFAAVNPVTYGVDASRAMIVGADVMTVIEVSAFSGIWNTLVPAFAVLGGYVLLTGVVAVFTIKRVTSTGVA